MNTPDRSLKDHPVSEVSVLEERKKASKELAKKLKKQWVNKNIWELLMGYQLNPFNLFPSIHVISKEVVVWLCKENEDATGLVHHYRVYACYKGIIRNAELVHIRPRRLTSDTSLDLSVEEIRNIQFTDNSDYVLISYTIIWKNPSVSPLDHKITIHK